MDDLIQAPDYVRIEFQQPFDEVIFDPAGAIAVSSVNGLTGAINITGGTTGLSFTTAAPNSDLTGTLAIANGGTGATTAQAARTNLSLEEFVVAVILDLNTNTKQTLYTVPAGKSATVLKVVLRSSSGDLSAGAGTQLNFGFDGGASDWNTATPLGFNAITAATQFMMLDQFNGAGAGTSVIGTAGQIFGAIANAAFGSAATVVVDVSVRLF